MTSQDTADQLDHMARGYNGIPNEMEIGKMSYIKLSDAFRSSQPNTVKYDVLERELKRRQAKDQANINRPNMLLAAMIGGIFALAGVALGAYLKPSAATHPESLPMDLRQGSDSSFKTKPPLVDRTIDTGVTTLPSTQQAAVSSAAVSGDRRP